MLSIKSVAIFILSAGIFVGSPVPEKAKKKLTPANRKGNLKKSFRRRPANNTMTR
jgi:hypothetical protein